MKQNVGFILLSGSFLGHFHKIWWKVSIQIFKDCWIVLFAKNMTTCFQIKTAELKSKPKPRKDINLHAKQPSSRSTIEIEIQYMSSAKRYKQKYHWPHLKLLQVLGCSWTFLWNNAKAVRFAISCWRTDTSSWMLTLLYAKWLLKFLSLICFRSIELRPREMPPLLLGFTMSNVKWKSQTKASLSNKNILVKVWKTNWLQNNEPLFFAKMLQSDYGLIFRRKNSDFRHSVATSPSLSWPSATTTTAKLRD